MYFNSSVSIPYRISTVGSYRDGYLKPHLFKFQSPIVSLQSGHISRRSERRRKNSFNPLSYLYSRVIWQQIRLRPILQNMFQSPIVSLQSGHEDRVIELAMKSTESFNPLSYLYSRVIVRLLQVTSQLGLAFQSPIVSLQSGHCQQTEFGIGEYYNVSIPYRISTVGS